MKYIVIFFIKLYQYISYILDPIAKNLGIPTQSCRFRPTCSNYTIDAVKKYGALKGIFAGIKRIIRCNPYSKHKYDPIK